MLGALGAGVLCVLALVLTGNQVNEKTDQIAELKAREAGAKSVADALRPYGQFATVAQDRETQIQGVVENRFDWDHVVEQLARTTPRNAWLLTVSGTVRPDVQVEAAGGSASQLRDEYPGPAFTIVGCTYSQRSVARMMARMNNIDGVSGVRLAKSAKKDEQEGAAGAGQEGQSIEEQEDCIGSSRVTKFEILVTFDAPAAAAAPAPAGVPQGGGAQVAAAADATAAAAGTSAASASGGGQ
jgi:Tfp pilus assembly protein PilN